jgi:ABC-type sugar transport system ATPase subunit
MTAKASPRRLLRVEALSKQRDGYPILERASMEAGPGQALGLVSESRERLSALIDILGGASSEDSGRILVGERELSPGRRLERVGVARERPALVGKLTVLDNIFLGNMRKRVRFGFLDLGRMRSEAAEALRRVESPLPLRAQLDSLMPAARVMVDIARVLVKDCDCLVFDSVTRSMNVRQYEAFAGIVRALKARGRCVILVPLNAQDVRTLVDRLYLLAGTELKEIEGARELGDAELNGLFLHGEKGGLKSISDPVYKARLLMEERAEEGDIDLHEVAGAVFMSYDNFRRKFKAQTGLSPNQYFIRLKIERAKELLDFTDLEIKEIAERLGFSDPYYFSRVFKDWEGLSPLRHRGRRDA